MTDTLDQLADLSIRFGGGDMTHRPDDETRSPYRKPSDHTPPRALVTIHYPIDMAAAAKVMQAVADAYPRAVVGENGDILEYAVQR